MSFDEILEVVGACGRYQIFVLILMNCVKILTGYETLLPIIIGYEQDFKCSVDETLNVSGHGSLVWGKCHVYRNETPHVRVACSQWTFDKSVMRTTIRSEFGLVCDRAYLFPLSTTIFFVGFIIGCTLYGVVSDWFGRMIGMLSSTAHLFVFSLAAAFSPTFWGFTVLRFFGGIGIGGLMSALFSMDAEVTDPSHAAFFSLMLQNGFSIGGLIIALLGYLVRDHFWIQIALVLPMPLIGALPYLIPESPRWLFATGRFDDAEKAVKVIARMNRRDLPTDFDILNYRKDCRAMMRSDSQVSHKPSLTRIKKDLVKLFTNAGFACTTMILWSYWFTVSLGFFAAYFSLGQISGIIFINLAINSLCEIPSRIFHIFLVKWFGRVLTLSACAIYGGFVNLVNAFLINQGDNYTRIRALSFSALFFFNGGFEVAWFYSGEVYPTVIRTIGVGMGSTWARIGGTIAPQFTVLYDVWRPAPFILIGLVNTVAGLAAMLLPETREKTLPDAMADGEEFMKTEFGLWKKYKGSLFWKT